MKINKFMEKSVRSIILVYVVILSMLSKSVLPWFINSLHPSSSYRHYSSSLMRLMSEKGKMLKPKGWQLDRIKVKKSALNKSISDDRKKIPPDAVDGLVIERRSDNLLVELLDDKATSADSNLIMCAQRSYLEDANIVCGDKVKIDMQAIDNFAGIVCGFYDRKNVLERPSHDSSVHKVKMKAIASNIDQLLIVTSVAPHVPSTTIDRFIVSAHAYGIPNIAIVINKMDLEGSQQLYKDMKYYTKLGYKLIKTCTQKENGLKDLHKILENKTSIFVGQSGVGKSSLVNQILPSANIRTAELVTRAEIGSHCTSSSRLYHLPTGGNLIDSPGIRELGTWHLSREAVSNGFIDIKEYAAECKFANCQHLDEPEKFCGVKRAVREGHIHPDRLLSYFRLINS